MPTLHEIERAFARSMLARDDSAIAEHLVAGGIAAADRLCIYRNTFASVAAAALRIAYPTVAWLVGEEFFEGAAAAFVGQHPPRTGYLNEYGVEFAAFLADFPPAASLCYLPDAARLDWAVNLAANAADAPALDAAALVALGDDAAASMRLSRHPAVELVRVRYPVEAVWCARLDHNEDALTKLVMEPAPHWLVVQRSGDGVRLRSLDLAEGEFTAALMGGTALAALVCDGTPSEHLLLFAEHLSRGRFAGLPAIDRRA
ncbi:MAG TPA: DNA-binding domain-containing protein [Candidatus Cybelea sp.]|nr:DNA-binding domain-containing protein [Candidatus Cybelea sp.]